VGAIGMTWLAMMTARSRWGKGWLFTPFGCLKEDRKDLFSFAFSTKLSSIISVIAKESESLWVNGLLGNAAGGYYSLARYFISLLQIPISPLPNTTYPELTREAAKENWVEVKDILKKGTRLAAVYSVPVSLVLVVFGKLIIRLYSSVEFYPAYPILVILVVGYFIMNLFYWNRVGLLTLNRPVYPTVVNFVFMVVKITLMFAFIPPMETTFMAILFSGYLLFTTLFAVVRVYSDLNAKIVAKEQFLEGSLTE
jgi:O-antigen/teichoic acid export membrane protein